MLVYDKKLKFALTPLRPPLAKALFTSLMLMEPLMWENSVSLDGEYAVRAKLLKFNKMSQHSYLRSVPAASGSTLHPDGSVSCLDNWLAEAVA